MRTCYAVGAAALALPLTFGLTGTATAVQPQIHYNSYSGGGCTVGVSNVKDTESGQNGISMLFDVKLTCAPHRLIRFERQLWDQDNGKPGENTRDDLVHSGFGRGSWIDATHGPKMDGVWFGTKKSSDSDRTGEFFQKVRFQVRTTDGHPVTSAWSTWKPGPVSNIYV